MFLQYIRLKMFMKELHTALFVAPTGVGKTYLGLSLLENEYRNHFDFIVVICPTLEHNETYKSRGRVWNDPDVIPIKPGNNLYYLIEKISNLLAGSKTLFLIDDIIADEALNKRKQPLLGLAISGCHRKHSLWLLTQSYTTIPNNIRRQNALQHNKMLEYLNFCLLCTLFALILHLYIRTKKYFPLLKMAEEVIGNLGYDPP